jgi:molybdopterin-guanine dinucleotide biosynthesis protein A
LEPAPPGENADRSAAPLAAILAGGASRRFGSDKALACVGGVPVFERVRGALLSAEVGPVVAIGSAERVGEWGLPFRGDLVSGRGPLAGVESALRWALEEGRPGALCVACDLPFLPPALLAEIAALASSTENAVAVPESTGRRGMEPLCAYYPASALDEVRAVLAGPDVSLQALLGRVPVRRVALALVREHGDPEIIFLNLNTPADLARAEALARSHAA